MLIQFNSSDNIHTLDVAGVKKDLAMDKKVFIEKSTKNHQEIEEKQRVAYKRNIQKVHSLYNTKLVEERDNFSKKEKNYEKRIDNLRKQFLVRLKKRKRNLSRKI